MPLLEHRFILHIHSCFSALCTDDVFMERAVFLPFLVVPGVRVEDPGKDWESGDVQSVTWNAATGVAYCHVEPDKQRYDVANFPNVSSSAPSMDEIVADYAAAGWTRRSGP